MKHTTSRQASTTVSIDTFEPATSSDCDSFWSYPILAVLKTEKILNPDTGHKFIRVTASTQIADPKNTDLMVIGAGKELRINKRGKTVMARPEFRAMFWDDKFWISAKTGGGGMCNPVPTVRTVKIKGEKQDHLRKLDIYEVEFRGEMSDIKI